MRLQQPAGSYSTSRHSSSESLGNPVASISRPTTGQPAASTSKCNQQYIQMRATVDQLLICIQSQAEVPVAKIQTQKRNSCCAKCCDKQKTTAERTAVEQFVGEYSAIQTQSTLKMEESMAEIKSCILPGIKGTRFVLFWEIVQFTEERCTYLERRQFGLDKRRRDLNSLSNGHIRTEAI
ncbi:ATP synthase D chain-related protein [Dorcoceras hygrometricum]|uniref:ATP synthase D chain-related protein n=1 Tax=Dorcoceras hygrometricum TaxID=472368 RepID=A0A2Z6ZVV3_9LAMI|nr:ATP synthase D chain-related protein [Dorcoceras hygrometricum]